MVKVTKWHGYYGKETRFRRIWSSMNQRCKNKNNPAYKNYGARGIKCLWKSFVEFKKDMHRNYLVHIKKYGETDTTIDRIDNNSHYSKKNCKWSTNQEQMNNLRKNIKIIYKRKMFSSLLSLARYLKINPTLLKFRIYKKWPQNYWNVKPKLGRNHLYDKTNNRE